VAGIRRAAQRASNSNQFSGHIRFSMFVMSLYCPVPSAAFAFATQLS
jgi:hypothetical protein